MESLYARQMARYFKKVWLFFKRFFGATAYGAWALFCRWGRTIQRYWHTYSYFRKTIGVILIVYGVIALVTPVLPGAWCMLIGLELLGVQILLWQKFKEWFFASARFLWSKGRSVRPAHLARVFALLLVVFSR